MNVDFGIWDLYRSDEAVAPRRAIQQYDQHFRMVEQAENIGFNHYYTIEHQGSFLGEVTAPTVLLAALSQRTTTMRLGSLIWQLPFHHPLRLAQDIAMLDQLSRGRVEFGTGLGVHEHEFIRWGIDFEARQAMAEESLEVIRRAWTNDFLDFEGKYWKFSEAVPIPKPYQWPHPPIWSAVHSHRSIEFAARNGLDVAQNIDTDEDIAAGFAHFRKVWKELHGETKSPRTLLVRTIYVADTDEKAHEEAAKHMPHNYGHATERVKATRIGMGTSQYLTGPIDTKYNEARRKVFAGVRKSYQFALDSGVAVVGSPDTVAKKIREQIETMGLDVYCGEFHMGDLDLSLVEKSVDLFGRHVIPQFR